MAPAQPKSVFEMILAWSASRPAWQQDALRRIVTSGALDAAGVAEMVQLCKKGCGASDVVLVARPLEASHLPASATASSSVAITSITSVSGVNRLSPGQTLAFAPTGITVVYGDNGVGKSGYSRILKRACRARFPEDILPNAFDPQAVKGASATIGYSLAGVAATAITWTDADDPSPPLSAISVFDRECGRVHVRDKNEVAFRPFGLDVPDDLAALCIAVKEALTTEQEALKAAQDSVFVTPTFNPTTAVGKILSALGPKTDLSPLETLAAISEEEAARLIRLRSDLARDPAIASSEQRLFAQALTRMANELAAALTSFSDTGLSDVIALGEAARRARAAARLAAETAFTDTTLPDVGGESWKLLWEAARRYSAESAYPAHAFPCVEPDSACVLCQQPLGAAAGERMKTFETFVRADVEQTAHSAEEAFEAAILEFSSKSVAMPGQNLRRQLKLTRPELARDILRATATARLRRNLALRAAKGETVSALPPLPSSPEAAIRKLAAESLTYADALAAASDVEGRRRLEAERDGLVDRERLSDLLPKARREVARLASLDLLKKCLSETTTNAITTLGNSIADEVITPKVRDRFQEEIQKLAASRVRVDIVRSGGKFGSPHYQVRLFANEKAKVGQVLSEGEQTCVGLAAFLTELTTSAHRSTLVFDDPVSSLDHRWRHKVAERLVEEAGVRQIIVFTHDLIFLNDLQSLAQEKSVGYSALSLIQSSEGAGVVTTDLPWIAAKVPERVDNLEKEARAAKLLYEANDDAGYAEAVARIYSRLRSTWERGLEDVALCNVVNRHRDYINTKELAKVTALEITDVRDFQTAFKKCCDQTEAHDPSRGRNASPPPPDEVLADIAKVRPWMDAIRLRQKSVA